MRRNKKIIIPAAVIAGTAVGGGLHLFNINRPITNEPYGVMAYTSPVNTQDPATAPEGYVINFPDVNLKRALNPIIAAAMNEQRRQQGLPQNVVRTPDQTITAGDMKAPVNMYGPWALNTKGITNIEGLQFLVNATRIDMVNNQVTNFAPLRDLDKLEELNIGQNPMTDLTPIASIPNLKKLSLDRSPNVTDISPLAHASKLVELRMALTKVSNLTPISQMANLEQVHFNNTLSPTKLDLTPLATAPKLSLINANACKLTGADFAVLKDAPALETLMTAGNNVLNMNDMLKEGFVNLQRSSTFSDQLHSINTDANPLFENPVRGVNNEIIPVTETANVKNANADGSLNPNGTHIKLVNLYGRNRVDIRWEKEFTKGHVTNRPFSGTLMVSYNLPQDTIKPTITPSNPEKLVSRKGRPIDLDAGMSAEDNPSGSGLRSFTHDAVAKGLDVTNPVKGEYQIVYTATDNHDNINTATRQVEITDADDLQAIVNGVTEDALKGYTALTKERVLAKKSAAEAIIAKNDATQAQIDQALDDLNQAIRKLEVDTRKLVAAATNRYNAQPDYVQQDPGVQAALAEANRVLNDPAKTPETVDRAARDLIKAIEDANKAETERQKAASDALDTIKGDDKKAARTPSAIQDIKDKINAIKDGQKRNALLRQLQPVEDSYNAKKDELNQLLDRAKNPATTDGASPATVAQLQNAIQSADAVKANTNASQEMIETALSALQTAIDGLRTDKTALQTLINSMPSEPDYVKNDPEVVAKKAEADRIMALENPTKAQVAQAVQDLNNAIQSVRRAEQDRQTAAEEVVIKAETDKTVYVFDQAEAKINEVKDHVKKAQLTGRLQTAKQVYDNTKNNLQNAITNAENPVTTDGMTTTSVARLQQALNQAKQAMAEKTPQQTIEVALNALNQAIAQLEVDETALDQAMTEHNGQPDYIKNDPAVQVAKTEADRVKALPSATKPQIQQATSGLKNAIRTAKQAEVAKQNQAEQELAQTTADLSPASITASQNKINAVQDPAKKAELQAKLDGLRQKLADQKQALRDLIAKAQDPATIDGMTTETKNALLAKINDVIPTRDAAQAGSNQILSATTALQQAIDALRADKSALVTALNTADAEPAYLKGKTGFRRALDGGRAINNNPNPTVAEVRAAVLALQNAKPEAVLQENQAQQAMDSALIAAQQEIDRLPSLANDQLFNIDLANLDRLINQVDEPAKKAQFQATLATIKTAYNKRKAEVEAKYPKSPNTGYQKQAKTGLLAALISLPVTVIAVVVKKLKRQ